MANLLALVMAVVLFSTSFAVSSPYLQGLYQAAVVLFLAVPVLNRTGLDLLARLILSATGVALFLLVGTSTELRDMEREQFFRLFIFGLVFVPLAVFSSRELFYQVLGALMPIVAFFAYPVVDELHNMLPYFPPTNKAVTDVLLLYVGPGVLFGVVIGTFLHYQWLESRATERLLVRERQLADELRRQEELHRLSAHETDRLLGEAKANEQALRAQNTEMAAQTERLEEARNNMRRLVKRLRTGQVQLEEQQAVMAERQFVDAGLARLASEARYRHEVDLTTWAQQVIETLLLHLEAANAALYLAHGDRLELAAATAQNKQTATLHFTLGRGSVGAVAQHRRPLVTTWPETGANGHRIATSLFSLIPQEIFTLPLVHNGELLGVLEVTTLAKLHERQRSLLLRSPEVVAPNLHAFQAQLEIKRLLLDAQAKTQALLAQEEELRRTIGTLEATQEQMRQTQELLLAEEAKLNGVINATSDSILLIDPAYRILLVNHTMRERYLRYGHVLKVGQNMLEFITPQPVRDEWHAIYDRALAGDAQHFTGTRIDDGQTRYVEYAVNPVPDATGAVFGVSVFSRDVTERIEAERALRERELQLRQLNETLEDEVAKRTQEVTLNASLLETTFETTRDCLVVVDRANNILTYNRGFVELFRFTPDEVTRFKTEGTLAIELTRVTNPEAYAEHTRQVEAQNPLTSTYVAHLTDGRVVSVFSRRSDKEEGQVGRVWGFTDITELYRSEQNLRENELRLRRFFALAQEGLLFHENGIVFDLNPSMAALLELPLGEALGKNLFEYVHPDDLPMVYEYFHQSAETAMQIRVITAQQRVLHCEVVARNLEIDGKAVRAVALRDVTERLQAENQLLAIARANPNPLIIFRHSDAEILYANQHFEKLLGYKAEELIGAKSKILYYFEEDKPKIRDQIRLANGRLESYEICARTRDGKPVWVVLSSELITFRGELAIILSFYDISERRASEQRILEAKQQMESAYAELRDARDQLALSEKLASLGQIIAGVAHEINTPVAALTASSQHLVEGLPQALSHLGALLARLPKKEATVVGQFIASFTQRRRMLNSREERQLRRGYEAELQAANVGNAEEVARQLVEVGFQSELKPFLNLITSTNGPAVLGTLHAVGQCFHSLENLLVASEKTRTIVGALKRYTHLGRSTEEGEHTLGPISLNDNLNTILILYAHQIRTTALLTTHFEGDLYVVADGDRLGQVWTNLITNALQAMPAGGQLMVEVLDGTSGDLQRPGRAVVRVTDTGSGIPEHVLPKIFDPFFTTKPKGVGTGIGLHISRQIIEGYGGRISVQSQPGRTVFEVDLPVEPIAPQA